MWSSTFKSVITAENTPSYFFAVSSCIDFPDSETVTLTEKGMQENGFLDPASMSPVSDEEVQDLIRDMLKPDMAKIFDELLDGHPRSLNSLAATLDYERRPDELKKVLHTMKSIHLVFVPRDPSGWKMKMVQLTDVCFPLGRHYT
jgi:hypothetical protein